MSVARGQKNKHKHVCQNRAADVGVSEMACKTLEEEKMQLDCIASAVRFSKANTDCRHTVFVSIRRLGNARSYCVHPILV